MYSLTVELEAYVHDLRERRSLSGPGERDHPNEDGAEIVFPSNFDEVVDCMNRHDLIPETNGGSEATWSGQALADGIEEDLRNDIQSHWISNSTDTSQDISENAENEQNEELQRQILRMEVLDRKLRHREMKAMAERWKHESELESLRQHVESKLGEYERIHGVAPPRVVLETFTTNTYAAPESKSSFVLPRAVSPMTHESALSGKEQVFLSVTGFDDRSNDTSNGARSDATTQSDGILSEGMTSTLEEVSQMSSKYDTTSSHSKSNDISGANAPSMPHIVRNKKMASRFGGTSLTEDEDKRLDLLMNDDNLPEECYGGQENLEKEREIDEHLLPLGYSFGKEGAIVAKEASVSGHCDQANDEAALRKSRALRVKAKRSAILLNLQTEREHAERRKLVNIALKRLLSAPLEQVVRPSSSDEIMTHKEQMVVYATEINELVIQLMVEVEEEGVKTANSKDVDDYVANIREMFMKDDINNNNPEESSNDLSSS